ncbi:MAG TPA: ABC transporter permease, partial [Rectinemataceae bacterium]|nr:ABC transporter permease [Rectinemataceae bacterium]
SLIVTYVFGREYVEGVSKYLLSLPLSRSRMVFAKFLVSFAWFAALSVTLIAECLLVGQVLGLGPIPGAEAVAFGARTLLVTCLLFTLAPAVAWMAVGSGGFLAPLGYAIFTLMLGMVFGATDWAPWCPWAIVPLLTGAAGPARASLDPGSYVVLAVFLLVGWLGTTLWLAKADNLQ